MFRPANGVSHAVIPPYPTHIVPAPLVSKLQKHLALNSSSNLAQNLPNPLPLLLKMDKEIGRPISSKRRVLQGRNTGWVKVILSWIRTSWLLL